ncbi:hypothetical protein HYT23_04855 [Candidatus Pacearchaeota archaeon]|nr:hypothetical protein [Candidatus Pacearchaeota archaeon]
MKRRFVVGFILFFLGVAIVLSSMTGMTGFVISSNLSASLNAVLGLVPIIAGLVIIFLDRKSDDRRE